MTIIGDVLKELFKMFVADLRLTLAILSGVLALFLLLHRALIDPTAAGFLLLLICLLVLAEAVFRETLKKRRLGRPTDRSHDNS